MGVRGVGLGSLKGVDVVVGSSDVAGVGGYSVIKVFQCGVDDWTPVRVTYTGYVD